MPVTSYYTVNGEIIGERTTGQSRVDYLTDALGSVVATVDQTLTTKSTARYKPFGADLATTGAQVMYGWVGGPGYRRTRRPHAEAYVRARTYSCTEGLWLSVDPTWPNEPSYIYCRANSISIFDPSGLGCHCNCVDLPNVGDCGIKTKAYRDACQRMCTVIEKALENATKDCENNGAFSLATHQINGMFGPCVPGNPYTKICRDYFSNPDGDGWNGDYGNKSDGKLQEWPLPACCGGYMTADFCNVECKLRVCCNLLGLRDPINTFKRWEKKLNRVYGVLDG